MAQLLLADIEGLELAGDLGLAVLELCAEGLLALCGADSLGLELLGYAFGLVADLQLRLG